MYLKVTSCANDRWEAIVWRVRGELWTFSLEKALLTDTRRRLHTILRWFQTSLYQLQVPNLQGNLSLNPHCFLSLSQLHFFKLKVQAYISTTRGVQHMDLRGTRSVDSDWPVLFLVLVHWSLLRSSIPYMQEHFIESLLSHFRVCTSASVERQ